MNQPCFCFCQKKSFSTQMKKICTNKFNFNKNIVCICIVHFFILKEKQFTPWNRPDKNLQSNIKLC